MIGIARRSAPRFMPLAVCAGSSLALVLAFGQGLDVYRTSFGILALASMYLPAALAALLGTVPLRTVRLVLPGRRRHPLGDDVVAGHAAAITACAGFVAFLAWPIVIGLLLRS